MNFICYIRKTHIILAFYRYNYSEYLYWYLTMNSSLNETDSVANDSKIIIVTEGLSSQFYISLFLLYIPGIVTNIISLIVIVYEARHTGRPTNFLLFILCLTDLVAVATTAFWHNMGRFGVIQTYSVCAVKTFMQIFCPIFSGAISVLLALDRALAFCAPFFYRSNITKKVWSAACFGASMIVSCLCVLPHLGLGSLWNPMYKGNTVRYSCTAFRYQEELKKKTFLIVLSTIGLLIIFSIITCNAVVVREVLKLRKRQADVKKSSGSLMQSKATELRFAIIVVVLACVFLTCWVPYNVSRLLHFIYTYLTIFHPHLNRKFYWVFVGLSLYNIQSFHFRQTFWQTDRNLYKQK